MVVSELPTLDTSYSLHTVDSDDDSDDGEDEAELILDVRAARQRVAAARESADVYQAVRQNTVCTDRLRWASCIDCQRS
jgi:hypothetical protein